MNCVHLDFETRSRADLASVGSHRYSVDPSTEIFMAGVARCEDDSTDPEVFLWVHPKFRFPGMSHQSEDAEILLRKAKLRLSHNANFEQAVTWGCGFDKIVGADFALEDWRCTAAMARKAGLPSSLGKCAEALQLPQQKDPRGRKLIKFFSEPKEDGTFNEPKNFPEEFRAFGEYCKQDVRTEKAIHRKLKAFELTGLALETFQFDLRMNQRGIPVNVPALRNAQRIIDEVQREVSAEFRELTGLKPTQRAKVLELLQSLGVEIKDMQADTLDGLKTGEPKADRIIELYGKLSYAAVKKIGTALDVVCPDGRVRGCHLYYGAGTGRWAGKILQPQNFKKTPKWMRGITRQVYADIAGGWDAGMLESVYGDPLELISGCIRHFIHQPGTEMLDGDYSAIEARIIDWIAGQDDLLKMWREGADIYRFMAAEVYGVPLKDVDDDMRSFAKILKLAGGFGMGPGKYLATCEAWGVPCTAEKAENAIQTFRRLHPKVQAYWYKLDRLAREAIACPGRECGPFVVRFLAGMQYLLFKLPSGRALAYPQPKVEVLPGPDTRDQITYWGQIVGSVNYGRVKLYGGKLAENCIGEGTEVLTPRGWVPIQNVAADDLVWDGVEWVKHEGLICRGEQDTINFGGVPMTPDHEVFGLVGKIPANKACVEDALKTGSEAWQNLVSNSKVNSSGILP